MISKREITKICMVCSPSFSRCFNPIMMQSNALSHVIVDEDEYIALLRTRVESLGLPWLIEKDTTYSDAKEIQEQGFDIILAIPGLKLMFASRKFDKNKIIHLDYFSYATKDVNVAVQKLKSVINANKIF